MFLFLPIVETSFVITSIKAETQIQTELPREISFTNYDVLVVAKQLYAEGTITKEDFTTIHAQLTQRWGVKEVNKAVYLGNNTYDYYLNNVMWSLILYSGTAAMYPIMTALGVPAGLADFLSGAGGNVMSTLANADKGVII